MRLFAAVFSVPIMFLSTPAISGPLGVDFTTATPEALGCKQLPAERRYSCQTMPDQSWSLADYWLSVSRAGNICTISGNSAFVESGPDGAGLRAAMESLKDQIEDDYGEPQLVDRTYGNRLAEDGESWMAQLGAMKRIYFYGWSFDPPRDGVSDMVLIASSNGADQGALQLQVNTPAASECITLN